MRAINFNSSKAALQTNKHTLISITLKLGSDSIHIVTKHKHRGLNISRHLRFNCNTKEIVRKANTELVPLYEVAAHIPRLALMQIYINCIRRIFDYADIVYIGQWAYFCHRLFKTRKGPEQGSRTYHWCF